MTDYSELKIDYGDPSLTSIFDELSLWSARFGILLLEHLELRRGLKVLDLGCGTGFPLFELAHTHGDAGQFIGLDVWQAGLNRAAWKIQTYGTTNVRLIAADGANLPLPSTHIDLIVSNLGINNFEDPAAVLAECARVAKAQARLVLTTNLTGHMQEFYDVFRATLVGLGKTHYLDRLTANEAHRGTKDSVCALVEGAGFHVVRLIEDSFSWRYLDGSALLRHPLTRVGFLDGWCQVVDRDDEVAVFSVLEKKLNTLAQQKGELKMTIPMLYVESQQSPGVSPLNSKFNDSIRNR